MKPPQSTEWMENRPTRGLRPPDLGELWRHRELAAFLALRDVKVRYKQAVFGVAWAVVQPLAGVVVFTVVFGRFAKVPSEGIPYPLFALIGVAAWSYTSGSVSRATESLVSNSALVTKVYFPRLLAPVASILPGLLDLAVSLLAVGVFLVIFHVGPTWAIVTLPLWLIMMMATVLGVGLWLGTLNVSYRDINQAVALLIQMWMFVTPVAYPSSLVPSGWRGLYFVNPMAGVVEGFRWALAGTPWPGNVVFISLAAALVVLIGGIAFFQRGERRFADVI
jgi:ABC-type polysaccharide/polyol phosphate export permease